jgi:hypothetical protein
MRPPQEKRVQLQSMKAKRVQVQSMKVKRVMVKRPLEGAAQ